MDLIKTNTIELTTGYYFFEVKDVAKYANSIFEPKIFISRVNDKVIKLYVQIFEHVRSTQRTYLRRMIAYNQNVDNQEDYFRHLQNNNNELAIPNALIFLEKVVTTIQQIVEKQSGIKEAAINILPNDGTDLEGEPTITCWYSPATEPDWAYCKVPGAPNGEFTIQNYDGASARLTQAYGTDTDVIAAVVTGRSVITYDRESSVEIIWGKGVKPVTSERK